MIELTLVTLLNSVSSDFCKYRGEGNDSYKSLLLSYSDASDKFGTKEVKKVVEESTNLTIAAVAMAVTKCPQHL